MTADTQVAKTEPYAPPAKVETQNYATDWWNPTTYDKAVEIAERFAKTNLVPKDYKGKPDDIVVAWSLGAPLGLSMLASLSGIAVINGRPSIYGDAALAVCSGHPQWGDIDERIEGEGDRMVAVCTVTRRGKTPARRTFSVAEAKSAGLWGKQGPWTHYPKRMLQMRARGFALRDTFADALCGMPLTEEVRDITPEVTVVDTQPLALPAGATATEKLKAKLRPARVIEPEPEPEPEDTGVDRAALEDQFDLLCMDRAGGDRDKADEIAFTVLRSQDVEDVKHLDDEALVALVTRMEERLKGGQ